MQSYQNSTAGGRNSANETASLLVDDSKLRMFVSMYKLSSLPFQLKRIFSHADLNL